MQTNFEVHAETLKVSGQGQYWQGGKKGTLVTFDRYTVEVTINGDRRAIPCTPMHEQDPQSHCLSLHGIAVKFETGAKVWPGRAVYWFKTGHVNNIRPQIDKRTAHRCHLVGYAADYAASNARSQHNAVK